MAQADEVAVEYMTVRNLDRYQSYKDRNPSWIKLYLALPDDHAFGQLPDAAKAHLMLIWTLAARTGNKFPADPRWIAQRIAATEEVNLEPLVEAGFLVRLGENDVVEVPGPSSPKQKQIVELRGENVKEGDFDEVAVKIPCSGGGQQEVDVWLSFLQEQRALYPAVDTLNEAKRARQWTLENMSKRKTPGGMRKFLGRWFREQQDKPRRFAT